MQLIYNLSTHDGHVILWTNHDRKNCDLYRQHSNLHSDNRQAQRHSETSFTNISWQQIVASSQKVQISLNQDQLFGSHHITR